MIQSRTHNCNELRLSDAGKNVTIVGWYENIRKVSKNLGFLILRDFYGTTQVVIETEEMMQVIDSVNKESTISVTGVVRERSSKNTRPCDRRDRSCSGENRNAWENVFTMHFHFRSTSPKRQMRISRSKISLSGSS